MRRRKSGGVSALWRGRDGATAPPTLFRHRGGGGPLRRTPPPHPTQALAAGGQVLCGSSREARRAEGPRPSTDRFVCVGGGGGGNDRRRSARARVPPPGGTPTFHLPASFPPFPVRPCASTHNVRPPRPIPKAGQPRRPANRPGRSGPGPRACAPNGSAPPPPARSRKIIHLAKQLPPPRREAHARGVHRLVTRPRPDQTSQTCFEGGAGASGPAIRPAATMAERALSRSGVGGRGARASKEKLTPRASLLPTPTASPTHPSPP